MKNETLPTIPQRFLFNDKEIDFEITGENVMVNATQMAKVFDKRIDHFLKSDHANEFIGVLELTPFGGSSEALLRDEIIKTNFVTGTWMHKLLALKFAAWLSPAFEVWVYSAIYDLVFSRYREMEDMLRRSAETKNRIETLKDELRDDPRFSELEELELLDKQFSRKRSVKINNQLELFRSINQ
jgi:hypothetical protein